jgi:hypothetical protein
MPLPIPQLPVPGRAGARASTVHVALTRDRRRRTAFCGRPGEFPNKEVSAVPAKKKAGGKKKAAKKSSKKR